MNNSMKKERIGLFGGTFNPIHSGHLKAAVCVREKFDLKRVLFVPSFIPPHKTTSEIAAPEHRLNMVELALAFNPRFESSSIEIAGRGKSYSIHTLEKVKKLYPEARIFFILGIDAFLEIDTWKDYGELLEQCIFLVISRPGYRLQQAKNVLGGRYRERMFQVPDSMKVRERDLEIYKIFLLCVKTPDIASSDIRKKIMKGESLSGLLPESVENYIKENKLYWEKK